MSTRKMFSTFFHSWPLVLGFISCAASTQDAVEAQIETEARRFTFKYQNVDDIPLPAGIQAFQPVSIRNNRTVYGFVIDADFQTRPAFLEAGKPLTILPILGHVIGANERGTMAGTITLDPVQGTTRAALFHGTRVEVIPRPPGEIVSGVDALSDSGAAVVASMGASGRTLYLYRNGNLTELPGLSNPTGCCDVFDGGMRINRNGVMTGTANIRDPADSSEVQRGYRYNTAVRKPYLLELPGDDRAIKETQGIDINNHGHIAGEITFSDNRQLIGVWDQAGHFTVYDQYPNKNQHIFSLMQHINNRGVMVETFLQAFSPAVAIDKSYLLPRPGVKLNIENHVIGLPEGQKLRIISDINDRADMIGTGPGGLYILQRVFPNENSLDYISTPASPETRAQRRAAREAALSMPQWRDGQQHTPLPRRHPVARGSQARQDQGNG